MAKQVTHYKVFIASPGGLEAERKEFREALSSHNEADAIARSCFFEPIGWEITLGGIGRPQGKINEDLKSCDYFVLVLWNRWGSATGIDGATSGTHEEYLLARQLLKSSKADMREVVVFFKGLEPALLADPGPQLAKVLEFKRTLEDEKELLFESFDTATSFSDKLKRHLAEWTRAHESKVDKGHTKPTPIDSISNHDDGSHTADETSDGNQTDLEKRLAFDMTNIRSMQSFEKYGKFLMQQERFSDAERVYREMYDLASDVKDLSWASTALARIAGTYRAQGKLREGFEALQKALHMKREAGDRLGESMTLTFLGDICASTGKPEEALNYFTAALEANPEPSERVIASLKWKAAKCSAELGNEERAEALAEETLQLAKKNQMQGMVDSIRQWRKARKRRAAVR